MRNNFLGVTITKELSAVTRTLVDALRTVAVWAVDLGLFYLYSTDYGEEWNKYSLVRLFGFVLCFSGTLMYRGIIKVPGLFYPSEEKAREVELEDEF